MDPENSLQDVVRCHLCDTLVPSLHCVICKINLCKECEGAHFSEKDKEHKAVPFRCRGYIPNCQKHFTRICERYCEQCKIPLCALCISTKEHQSHCVVDILKSIETKKDCLQKDLQAFQKLIYPEYEEFASNIKVQKAEVNENSKKLITAINIHGEELHREIDTIVKEMKSAVNDIDSKQINVLNKRDEETTQTISEIKKIIADLEILLNSNNISRVYAYTSRKSEFEQLPPTPTVYLP